MGHFANLYLIEIQKDRDITKVETSIYGGEVGESAYFSWGAGERPENQLQSFANGTLFCNKKLGLLSGYPLIERYPYGGPFVLDASFVPQNEESSVLLHIIFNKHFVPARDKKPFEQPCSPSVYKQDEKLILTYPIRGSFSLKFNVNSIKADENLASYDIEKLVDPALPTKQKRVVGINLYFFKFEWHIGE